MNTGKYPAEDADLIIPESKYIVSFIPYELIISGRQTRSY